MLAIHHNWRDLHLWPSAGPEVNPRLQCWRLSCAQNLVVTWVAIFMTSHTEWHIHAYTSICRQLVTLYLYFVAENWQLSPITDLWTCYGTLYTVVLLLLLLLQRGFGVQWPVRVIARCTLYWNEGECGLHKLHQMSCACAHMCTQCAHVCELLLSLIQTHQLHQLKNNLF